MLGGLFSQQHGSELSTFEVGALCTECRRQQILMHRSIPIIEKKEKAIAHSLATLCLVAFRASIQEWNDKSDNLTMLRLLVLTYFFLYHWKAFEAAFCSWLTPAYNQWKSWEMFSTSLRNKLWFGDVMLEQEKGFTCCWMWTAAAAQFSLFLQTHDCTVCQINELLFLLIHSVALNFLEATNPGRKKWQ